MKLYVAYLITLLQWKFNKKAFFSIIFYVYSIKKELDFMLMTFLCFLLHTLFVYHS